MYDRFSVKGAHTVEWFEIAKNFLKLAFAGDRREAKCLCNRCQIKSMFFVYEMSGHNAHRTLVQVFHMILNGHLWVAPTLF
jgi:hypothetical protein